MWRKKVGVSDLIDKPRKIQDSASSANDFRIQKNFIFSSGVINTTFFWCFEKLPCFVRIVQIKTREETHGFFDILC